MADIPDKGTWHKLNAVAMLHRMMDLQDIDSPLASFCEEVVNKIDNERAEGREVFRRNFDLHRTIDRQRDMAFGAAAALVEAFSHEYGLAATILKYKRNPSVRDIRLMKREGLWPWKKPRKRKEKTDVTIENQAPGNGHADSGARQG